MLQFVDEMAMGAHAAFGVEKRPEKLEGLGFGIYFDFLWFFGIIIVENSDVGEPRWGVGEEAIADEVVHDRVHEPGHSHHPQTAVLQAQNAHFT